MGPTLCSLFCILAGEEPFTHQSFDGFKIDAKIALPTDGKVARVMILLGGSGAYDMDLDLTEASEDKKTKILWLKDLSEALAARGFAVIRYHKRPYQMSLLNQAIQREKRMPTSDEIDLGSRFIENPLQHFVDDAKSFAEYARKRYPEAKIHFLGASEGTHIALWAAHELGWISGVALVGFYALPLDSIMFEQTLHRDQMYFRHMDTDQDGSLTKRELHRGSKVGLALLQVFAAYDFDRDQQLSLEEYKAFFLRKFSDILPQIQAYRLQEAKYPSMLEVLKHATFQVAFFQGLWDNQTPTYNAYAMEVLDKYHWKKGFRFTYFPKLGHCLDPRKSPEDLFYTLIDPKALETLCKEADEFFK